MAPRSPDPVVPWRFRVNQTISEASDLIMRAELLLQVKESFLGSGTWTDRVGDPLESPTAWSVDYSCDSAVAGTAGDAVDRWVDNGDLVWGTDGTDAYSWIVLRHDNFFGASQPLYVLFALTEASSATRNATLTIYLSQAGFTGGTTIARPTATDEHMVLPVNGTAASNSAGWQGETSSVPTAKRLHFLMSADGTKVRALFNFGGLTLAMWDLFLVDFAPLNWSRPCLMMVMSEDGLTENNTWSNAYNTSVQGGRWHGWDSTLGAFTCDAGMPGFTGVETPAVDSAGNTFDSSVMPVPVPLRGSGTPVAGLVTYSPDLWWVSNSNGTGDTATDDDGNARAFAQFGELMVDWNRSVPLT